MPRPVLALLTDFGTRDHYAGTLKGVILGICPDTTLVDLSHDIPPHDVMTASLELAAGYKYFPAGTIFLVVVDPGVGSARRGSPRAWICPRSADRRGITIAWRFRCLRSATRLPARCCASTGSATS